MSQAHVHCPKCKAEMKAGFVPDFAYGAVLLGHWHEGELETKWLGAKLRDEKGGRPIITYRCSSCGFLEAYAK